MGRILVQRPYIWDIPKEYRPGMLVDGRIYASQNLLKQIINDKSLDQVVNVAFLPGIVGYSLAARYTLGYGFPIGGVAATHIEGSYFTRWSRFDINCG